MSTKVLGISAFYHDAAAALVEDGRIVAAAQEERFSRRKHDPRFPIHAINYCLEEAQVDVDALDAIVFYDDPVRTWDRVVKSCIVSGEPSRAQFEKAARSVLGTKIWVQSLVRRALGQVGKAGKLLTTEHHLSHAGSAFYPSPFERAAIITLDGVGEWATTTVGIGEHQHIDLLLEIDYPHSLGLLYSSFTYFCGFKVNAGEYKLMGLAPYGRPLYANLILDKLISVKPDGSYRLNPEYFGYIAGLEMTNDRFESLFGGPRRVPESRITRREMDIAASIQAALEEVVVRIARHARKETGARNLVMAGGVALNCVANAKILRAGIFDDLWIQPAAGDAGAAAGAALVVSHQYFAVPRWQPSAGRDGQSGSFLGPAFTAAEVRAFLDRYDLPYHVAGEERERAAIIADALSQGHVVGYFNGRMEFGPRALGARSILGDPRDKSMQSVMNVKIKHRESFRPFAPAVLPECAAEYFELDRESPYMLLVADVRQERRLLGTTDRLNGDDDDMLSLINTPRSDLPAITHIDYSARVQTIDPVHKPDFYAIVKAFKERTGCAVVVNTSFNVRGEPIVCSPKDAYLCFMRTEMDLLVLEDCLLWRSEQPGFSDRQHAEGTDHLSADPASPNADGDVGRLLEQTMLAFREMLQQQGEALRSLIDAEIGRLFEQTVLAFHQMLQQQGGEPLIAMEPDPASRSYYIVRGKRSVDPADFDAAAYDDTSGLAAALRKVWSGEQRIPLVEIADQHADLARLIAQETQTETAEVSASMYVMF